jgi:anti-sigma B factor antagonist
MQIDIVTKSEATVVKPAGNRLDILVAAEFRTALLQLIDSGQHRVIVDLGDVDFIDSSGLGALVSALKTLKLLKGDGDVRLANLRPPVVSLLEIIRLHRVFSSYASVEQAVQSFSQDKK